MTKRAKRLATLAGAAMLMTTFAGAAMAQTTDPLSSLLSEITSLLSSLGLPGLP